MSTLTTASAASILKALGFRGAYVTQVRNFQAGYNLAGAPLAVDGIVGPLTSAALNRSKVALKAGKPTASAHFSFSEFRCHGGESSGCEGVKVSRRLLLALEVYRAKNGVTRIVSGYRCPRHNKAVGGATASQHLYGTAADVDRRWSWPTVRSWRVFTGIGKKASNGLVQHVDVRSNATVSNPTVWNY